MSEPQGASRGGARGCSLDEGGSHGRGWGGHDITLPEGSAQVGHEPRADPLGLQVVCGQEGLAKAQVHACLIVQPACTGALERRVMCL